MISISKNRLIPSVCVRAFFLSVAFVSAPNPKPQAELTEQRAAAVHGVFGGNELWD